jgi:hypothetical protein
MVFCVVLLYSLVDIYTDVSVEHNFSIFMDEM